MSRTRRLAPVVGMALMVACWPGVSNADAGTTVTLRGTLLAAHADAKPGLRGSEHVLYALQSGSAFYDLRLAKIEITPRATVEVTGRLAGHLLDTAVPGGGLRVVAAAATPLPVTGTGRLLVMPVSWFDARPTATPTQVQQTLFSSDNRSVASWYHDVSRGAWSWQGDVTPVISIDDPGDCGYSALLSVTSAAKSAASAAGYSTTSYDHFMVDLPTNSYCSFGGLGEVLGPNTWINDALTGLGDGWNVEVAVHELGHNLGLWHSHGLECRNVSESAGCWTTANSDEEYGNSYDAMGNNWLGDHSGGGPAEFSARQQQQLGWLRNVRAVPSSGDYTIAPLELASATNPQALTITTENHEYTIEYRQPIGHDSWFPPAGTEGVQINARNDLPGGDSGPVQIDTTPNSDNSGAYTDWYDATLRPGRTFGDVDHIFVLSVTSLSPQGATVHIDVAAQPGSSYHTVAPYRILDTRQGLGAAGSVPGRGSVTLQVTGAAGSPVSVGADGVALNVTVTAPAAGGYLSVGPALATGTSNLNFSARQTIPNLVISRLSAAGTVTIYNGSLGTVDVVADVQGYGTPSPGLH